MPIGQQIKMILLSTCIGGITLLHSEVVTHPFEIEPGMVLKLESHITDLSSCLK